MIKLLKQTCPLLLLLLVLTSCTTSEPEFTISLSQAEQTTTPAAPTSTTAIATPSMIHTITTSQLTTSIAPPTAIQPTLTQPATYQTTTSTTLFVGSLISDKYHYESCRYAKEILTENRITFSSIEEARSKGYKPCEVCKPPS